VPFPRRLGGALALDFVNTVDPRQGAEVHDWLDSAEALRGWAEYAGLPAGARLNAGDLTGAVELREALYSIFRSRAHDRDPTPGNLATLHAAYVAALGRARLVVDRGALDWRVPAASGADAILLPIVRSALDLLGSQAPVRECPGENCGWLFVDATKNGNRRWCAMDDCGSKAKMRRYRAGRRAGRAARPT
jgi:predicted RNA-binding Zn ribbon-like protein